MSVSFYINARGFSHTRRVLDRLSYFDARDLLDNVGAVVENQVRRRIEDQEGPPDGGTWEPLTDLYSARKSTISDGGFLELHGDLRDTLTRNVIGSDAIEIGSNEPYARAQQLGYPENNLPAREYLGLSPDNEDEIEDAISTWLRKVLGR